MKITHPGRLYWLAALTVVFVSSIFGLLLPMLISWESTELVVLGFGLMLFVPLAVYKMLTEMKKCVKFG